jgi:hypothetical protein
MPWTIAHAAAVLPLRKHCPTRLSFAGLVAGSFAPDMGYYVEQFALADKAHTVSGAAFICVPIGLVLLLLAQLLYRPVGFLLPQPHRGVLLTLRAPLQPWSLRTIGMAMVSVFIGALTHVCWDGFTHVHGYFVSRLPILQALLIAVSAA